MPISKGGDQKTVVYLHNVIPRSRKQEGIPTFVISLMELETIVLSELSQLVKDKYHMFAFIRGI